MADEEPQPLPNAEPVAHVRPEVDDREADPAPDRAASAAPDPAVARILRRRDLLASLDQRPLAEHPDVYAEVHADLHAALTEIDGV